MFYSILYNIFLCIRWVVDALFLIVEAMGLSPAVFIGAISCLFALNLFVTFIRAQAFGIVAEGAGIKVGSKNP